MQLRSLVLGLTATVAMVGLDAADAVAQTGASIRVEAQSATVLSRRARDGDVLATIPQGTVLDVLGRDGDWYWVLLAADHHGTRRPGWMYLPSDDPAAEEKRAHEEAEKRAKAEEKAAQAEQAARAKAEERAARAKQREEAAQAKAEREAEAARRKQEARQKEEDRRLEKMKRELDKARQNYEKLTSPAPPKS